MHSTLGIMFGEHILAWKFSLVNCTRNQTMGSYNALTVTNLVIEVTFAELLN